MNNRGWTDGERTAVREMLAEGKTYAEIGLAINRSKEAVRLAVNRPNGNQGCLTQEHFNADAIIGSQRLLEAMMRLAA